MDTGNPQTLNRYTYVGNIPTNYIDPSGEYTVGDVSDAGASLGAIFTGIVIALDAAQIGYDIYSLFQHATLKGTTTKRPPWGPHNAHLGLPNLASILDLPDRQCEFGACGTNLTQGQNASGANPYPDLISDAAWAWALTGIHYRVHRFWTYGNYCGKDGSGNPTNRVDAACLQHDFCYSNNQLEVGQNTGPAIPALQGCNQALCNAMATALSHRNRAVYDETNHAADIKTFFCPIIGFFQKGNACH